MVQDQLVTTTDERRCPNCGTRVARDAENCFMCGHDLRVRRRRGRSVSLIDALLVLAVLAVLGFWWQLGRQTESPLSNILQPGADVPLVPDNIPTLEPTATLPADVAANQPIAPKSLTRGTIISTHEVVEGETLIELATRYGLSVGEIQSANDLETERILVGQLLNIPIPASDAAASASSSSNEGERLSFSFRYKVRENDTLFTIAVLYGTTVEAILKANGRTENEFIVPGEDLVLPIDLPRDVLADTASTDIAENSKLHEAPRQVGPATEAKFSRAEPILLRWLSVDQLQPNEWYVLLIYPSDGNASEIPTKWTKSNNYRLEMELAPIGNNSVSYKWQVSVVRVTSNDTGPPSLEAVSPPSDLRSFTWE